MRKLNEEEKEILRELKENGQWQVIELLCDIGVSEQETRLLAYSECDEREIFVRKCKLEGAKELARMIKSVQGQIKKAK